MCRWLSVTTLVRSSHWLASGICPVPLSFVRYDTNGSFVALTTSDLYLIQCYLAENSVPLMAGREKMVCICID